MKVSWLTTMTPSDLNWIAVGSATSVTLTYCVLSIFRNWATVPTSMTFDSSAFNFNSFSRSHLIYARSLLWKDRYLERCRSGVLFSYWSNVILIRIIGHLIQRTYMLLSTVLYTGQQQALCDDSIWIDRTSPSAIGGKWTVWRVWYTRTCMGARALSDARPASGAVYH